MLLLLALCLSCADAPKKKMADTAKLEQTQKDTYLKASIDGAAFYIAEPHYFSTLKIITIAAVSTDKTEKIRIYINYSKGPATYPFGKGISNSDNMVYTHNKVDWLAAKTNGEGSVTITEEGGYLIGKFSFTGVDKKDMSTKNITNGEFKVRIDS